MASVAVVSVEEKEDVTPYNEKASKVVGAFSDMLLRTLQRYNKCSNPVTRHLLFVNALLSMTDIVQVIASSNEEKLTRVAEGKMEAASKIFNECCNNLIEFIEQPDLGPDANFGRNVMRVSEKSFDEVAKKVEGKDQGL